MRLALQVAIDVFALERLRWAAAPQAEEYILVPRHPERLPNRMLLLDLLELLIGQLRERGARHRTIESISKRDM